MLAGRNQPKARSSEIPFEGVIEADVVVAEQQTDGVLILLSIDT